MPAIRLLGRRWMLASDDLVLPCLVEIPYRLLWFILMILVIGDSGPFPCRDGAYARWFAGGTLGLQLVMLLLLIVTAHQSARGSLMEAEKRKYVGPLLLCKLTLLVVEIGLNLMGIAWIFFDAVICYISPFSTSILKCLLIISWIGLVLLGLGIYLAYDPLGTTEYDDLQTEDQKENYHKQFTKIMAGRIKWAFWFYKDSKMNEAIMQLASMLSILFGSTDLVMYDLLAGSILLRVRQKLETRIRRQSEPDLMDNGDAPSWMTIAEANHYLRFATAAYGGRHVLYRNFCAGVCFLLPYLRCWCCWRPQHVIGDNCCMSNYAGLKYLSDFTDKDFIYVSFKNHKFEVPFYVVAEHSRKRIVVSVCGSISIPDMITDMLASAVTFQAEGLPENTLAHIGMALRTEKTYERLLPILEGAFEEYPNYELIITGHSLGAAVSTLLGIKLISKYPHLKVFAFSTPSGLLSREAARYTESFVMTVSVGDDLVMTISVKAAQMFRERLMETIHMTSLPKYRILLKGLRYMFFTIPESDLNSMWKSIDDIEAGLVGPRRLVRCASFFDIDRLYVGGRILHIVPHTSSVNRRARNREPKYKLRWASPDEFTELVVTPGMLKDAMPEDLAEPIRHLL